MSAVYSIFSSPHHPPVPDHLPTLIVCPHGKPDHVLYTYLHTNLNKENFVLTPAPQGDLCVAKLYPGGGGANGAAGGGTGSSVGHNGTSSSSAGHGQGSGPVRCEASRNLRWSIHNTGIQNPVYKLTLPNPDSPEQEDQPLFQVSKPNPHATWWTLFYFTYAGHLIPPKRVEFGKIMKNSPEEGGGTRLSVTGRTDAEKAVWRTLGEGNEDMVEWVLVCAALNVLDDEILTAAAKAGVPLSAAPGSLGASKQLAPVGGARAQVPARLPARPLALHPTGAGQSHPSLRGAPLPSQVPPPHPNAPRGPPQAQMPPPQQARLPPQQGPPVQMHPPHQQMPPAQHHQQHQHQQQMPRGPMPPPQQPYAQQQQHAPPIRGGSLPPNGQAYPHQQQAPPPVRNGSLPMPGEAHSSRAPGYTNHNAPRPSRTPPPSHLPNGALGPHSMHPPPVPTDAMAHMNLGPQPQPSRLQPGGGPNKLSRSTQHLPPPPSPSGSVFSVRSAPGAPTSVMPPPRGSSASRGSGGSYGPEGPVARKPRVQSFPDGESLLPYAQDDDGPPPPSARGGPLPPQGMKLAPPVNLPLPGAPPSPTRDGHFMPPHQQQQMHPHYYQQRPPQQQQQQQPEGSRRHVLQKRPNNAPPSQGFYPQQGPPPPQQQQQPNRR